MGVVLRAWVGVCALAWCGGCGVATDDASTTTGDFRTSFVGDEFVMTARQIAPDAITRIIARRFPERSDPTLDNATLAARIVDTAECFGIDAAVLAGLVRQESAYERRARSATGACGLTQFTSIGVREVNDQLGARGDANARGATIRFFNERIGGCVLGRIDRAAWQQLWVRAPASAVAQRDLLLDDAEAALVYGAVLVKTQLSVVRTLGGEQPLDELYGKALERYNGDPSAAVRADYRARVLRYAQETRDAIAESEP